MWCHISSYIIISYLYILCQEAKRSGKSVLSAFRAEGRSVPPAWHRDAHWMILTMTMSWWNRFKTLRDPGWWWMLTGTSRNAVQLAIIGICRIGWCRWIHNVCLFFRQVTTLQIVEVTCACTMKHLRHFVTSSSTVKQTTYIKYPLMSICWSRTWSNIKWYQIDQPHWKKPEPPNIHISFTRPYLQETPWPSLHIFGAGHAYSKGSMKYSM